MSAEHGIDTLCQCKECLEERIRYNAARYVAKQKVVWLTKSLTRYDPAVDVINGIEPRPFGEYVRLDDVQELLIDLRMPMV